MNLKYADYKGNKLAFMTLVRLHVRACWLSFLVADNKLSFIWHDVKRKINDVCFRLLSIIRSRLSKQWIFFYLMNIYHKALYAVNKYKQSNAFYSELLKLCVTNGAGKLSHWVWWESWGEAGKLWAGSGGGGMHAILRNRLPGRATLQNNRARLFCHVIQ